MPWLLPLYRHKVAEFLANVTGIVEYVQDKIDSHEPDAYEVRDFQVSEEAYLQNTFIFFVRMPCIKFRSTLMTSQHGRRST